ncbi:MAG: PDZ domain-containing protein [Candidatus Binataceae bacterium]
MKTHRVLIAYAFAAALAAIPLQGFAQSAGSSAVQVQGQHESSGRPGTAPQGQQDQEDDSTLEVSPQPGAIVPKAGVQEIPDGGKFHSSQDAVQHRPYLGITVHYTDRCYLGGEEHGLEIITVDPHSPAADAGLRGCSFGDASNRGTLQGQLQLAWENLRSWAGPPEGNGDLIVAVNDGRVRSQADLDDEIARLKPGDTMYLTVIRPVSAWHHETLKVEMRVGDWSQGIANAAPASAADPAH